MLLPPPDEPSVTWSTGIALALILALKFALRLPKDWFTLKEQRRHDEFGELTRESYNDLVQALRAEVARLTTAVQQLNADNERERRGRYAAEADAARLRVDLDSCRNPRK